MEDLGETPGHQQANHNLHHKNSTNSDTQKFAVITLKFEQGCFTAELMQPKDADGMANSVNPDQTEQSDFGSAVFAQASLSENLGLLR